MCMGPPLKLPWHDTCNGREIANINTKNITTLLTYILFLIFLILIRPEESIVFFQFCFLLPVFFYFRVKLLC